MTAETRIPGQKRHASPGRPVDEAARAARRQQIVEAAHRRFSEKGFHAASTAEISAEAGISVASLFQYFPTKNDLIHALVQYELEIDLNFLKMLGGCDDLYEGLAHLGHYLRQDPERMRALKLRAEVIAEGGRDPAVAKMLVDWEARVHLALKAVIAQAQARGQVGASIDIGPAATTFSAYCDGVLSRISLPMPDNDAFLAMAVAFLRRAFCDPRLA